MSAIADGIDFIMDLMSGKSNSKCGGVDHAGFKGGSVLCYFTFTFMWLAVWQKLSQRDFSTLITAAAVVQCLGFVILSMQVRAMKTVAGLSSKALSMVVLTFCVRLCSTTLKRGYIPVDRSGHYFYQGMDVLTVVFASHLIYCCHKTYVHSYQEEYDTLPLLPLVIPCVVLACFVHGKLNRSFFFDTVWFTSLNLETVAMLPQLWMLSKIGGKVSGMSSQFVASQIAKCVMSVTFWSWAYSELADKETGVNTAGQLIICANIVQLFLSADFMFYYVKGFLEGTDEVVLPRSTDIVM